MKFFKSLIFKITFAILVVEALALNMMGYYYVARFSIEIDKGVIARTMLPGTLISQKALSYEAVEDKDAMDDLVKEDVVESVLVRRDGIVFYAADKLKRNKSINEALNADDLGLLKKVQSSLHAAYRLYSQENLLSVVSPIVHDGSLSGFLLLKVNIAKAAQEKHDMEVFFMLSALVCMVATTIIAVLVIHRLIIPRMRATAACLEKVKHGDYSARIKKIFSSDELSDLQTGVNSMAARIEFNIRQINQAKAELEHAYHDLKNTQSQLVQSEKMAGIGEMAVGVTHEINNPVSFVISNLYILQMYSKNIIHVIAKVEELVSQGKEGLRENFKKLYDETQVESMRKDLRDLVEQTSAGAGRIEGIIKSLRDMAHPASEEFKPGNLNIILEETLALIESEIKEKALVHKDLGDIPEVFCNRTAMEQVFVNILVNAAQAIDKNGDIGLRTYLQDNFVFIEIKDNGRGIAPENLSKIFQPFFTTKESGKGTGLGLSIVHGIIKSHGGSISVKSAVNKGTTFIIKIPTDRRQGREK